MNLSQTSLRNSEGKRMCCLQRVYLLKKRHFAQGEILAPQKIKSKTPMDIISSVLYSPFHHS